MKIPYKFRLLNRLYAQLRGYFWLKCCLCGRHHGGHEDNGSLMTTYSSGVQVCPMCKARANDLNDAFFGRLKQQQFTPFKGGYNEQ